MYIPSNITENTIVRFVDYSTLCFTTSKNTYVPTVTCIMNIAYSIQNDFKYTSPGPIARALILSLSVCYHARLEKRGEYEEGVVKCFTGPIKLSNGAQQFRDEIRW